MHEIWTAGTFVVATVVFATACEPAEPAACEAGASNVETVVCAATSGGGGGASGSVLLVLSDADSAAAATQRLERLVRSQPGGGGLAGVEQRGPTAEEGAPGEDSEDVDVVLDEGFSFERGAIDPDARIDVTDGGGNTIALPDLSDPPQIAVAELRVRSGASLGLSCDVRIVAQRVVVEAGATLSFQTRNDAGCVWSMPAATAEVGHRGANVFIEAQELELDGTIDLSGASGAVGQPGGSGGGLTVVAETFDAGPDAAIVVSGGPGGDGVDEAPC